MVSDHFHFRRIFGCFEPGSLSTFFQRSGLNNLEIWDPTPFVGGGTCGVRDWGLAAQANPAFGPVERKNWDSRLLFGGSAMLGAWHRGLAPKLWKIVPENWVFGSAIWGLGPECWGWDKYSGACR